MSIIPAGNAIFLAEMVVRSHSVFHNQDLMEVIGKYLMPVAKDRGNFIRVCRVWRHVFYTRLIDESFQMSVRTAIFSRLCVDACILLVEHVPKPITIYDVGIIMKGTSDAKAIGNLLWVLPRNKITSHVRYFYNIIASPGDITMDRLGQLPKSYFAFFVSHVVRVDGLPAENLTRLFGLLERDAMVELFEQLLKDYPAKIPIILPHMTIDVDQFLLYMRDLPRRAELLPLFDDVCRAFARDLFVDHYAGCLNRILTSPHIGNWLEKYLQIGAGLPGFAIELFKGGGYLSGQSINSFILMGHIDPCSKVKYRFDIPNSVKMTIFEYANFIGNEVMYNYIINDPRFRAGNHLDILAFSCLRNRYRLATKFLKTCKLDKEELQEGLRLVVDTKEASRRRDTTYFDCVIRKLEKKITAEGPPKRIKLTIKVGSYIVAPKNK